MYVSKLVLRNIRGLGREFVLNSPDPNEPNKHLTVLIGKNGTCKTTILRCIALGLCWREDANALLAEPIGPMIAEGKNVGSIEVTLCTPKGESICIKSILARRSGNRDFVSKQHGRDEIEGSIFVWAAGAGRSGEGVDAYRDYQIVDSVYSLFNYEQSSLTSLELVLHRLKLYRVSGKPIYTKTMNGLKRVLGLESSDEIYLGRSGGVFVTSPSVGEEVPIEAWADGYRLTANWLLDAYAWAMRAKALTPLAGIKGILLVDEIEQHIHPSLHKNLLPALRKLLPDAQIFMTTHSPLTVLGTELGEVVNLKRDGKSVRAEVDTVGFSNQSVQDVLEDDRGFETSAYGPSAQTKIIRYKSLTKLSPGERSKKEANELSRLAKELMDSRPSEKASPLLVELTKLSEKYGL